MVDAISRQAPEPLVVTATGGKGGGGAKLTVAGRLAIRLFWELSARLQDFLEKETQQTQETLGR